MAIGPLSASRRGFDLVIVIGATVFRYYPYVAGPYLPDGAELLQITNDPNDATAAAVGDSLLSDAKRGLDALSGCSPKSSPTSRRCSVDPAPCAQAGSAPFSDVVSVTGTL